MRNWIYKNALDVLIAMLALVGVLLISLVPRFALDVALVYKGF